MLFCIAILLCGVLDYFIKLGPAYTAKFHIDTGAEWACKFHVESASQYIYWDFSNVE